MSSFLFACDQRKNRIVLYDLSLAAADSQLDRAEAWSFSPNHPGCINISDVKYRKNTVFGDVLLTVASGGYAGVISYPRGEVLWEIGHCGNNPHSIEILPNGDVACVSSTGKTLRLYPTSRLLLGESVEGDSFLEYPFDGPHGVLWDPVKNALWVLDNNDLTALSYSDGALRPDGRYPLPRFGGHDLAADLIDPDGLLCSTVFGVARFSKKTGQFSETGFPFAEAFRVRNIKGVGNDRDGSAFFCSDSGEKSPLWATKPYADWCSREICWLTEGEDPRILYSDNSAFYKIRVFCGCYL